MIKTLICLNRKNATIVENHWTWCEQAFIRRLKGKLVKTGLQVSLHESNNSQQHHQLLMAEIQITLHFQLEGEPTNSHSLKYWWVRGDVREKGFTSSDLGSQRRLLFLSPQPLSSMPSAQYKQKWKWISTFQFLPVHGSSLCPVHTLNTDLSSFLSHPHCFIF